MHCNLFILDNNPISQWQKDDDKTGEHRLLRNFFISATFEICIFGITLPKNTSFTFVKICSFSSILIIYYLFIYLNKCTIIHLLTISFSLVLIQINEFGEIVGNYRPITKESHFSSRGWVKLDKAVKIAHRMYCEKCLPPSKFYLASIVS